ncbi:MAG: ATPase [Nocardioidaceae bacterium]|nr:ATPase [Nocardioidaceae bacterium]
MGDPAVRLHVVTGKGGTGKTTVATALALGLASGGRRVLLCEAEGRQGIARILDVAPLPYEERAVALGAGGGEVLAIAIDPEPALLEYLDMYYRLGRAGRVLDRFGVVDFVTTIAPGLRDVLLTGKVYEAHQRRDKQGRHSFDAVVLDAPPTGRITRFLNVNHEVAGLAKVGPIRNQADAIMGVLHSRATAVHLVTLLEDMPVQETLDAAEQLAAISLPLGTVVVNQVRTTPLDDDTRQALAGARLRAGDLAATMRAAGLRGRGTASAATEIAAGLVVEGAQHVQRLALEERLRADVAQAGRPVVTLDEIEGGIDLGALYELADRLRQQGLA